MSLSQEHAGCTGLTLYAFKRRKLYRIQQQCLISGDNKSIQNTNQYNSQVYFNLTCYTIKRRKLYRIQRRYSISGGNKSIQNTNLYNK